MTIYCSGNLFGQNLAEFKTHISKKFKTEPCGLTNIYTVRNPATQEVSYFSELFLVVLTCVVISNKYLTIWSFHDITIKVKSGSLVIYANTDPANWCRTAYLVRRIPEANPSSSDSADNHDNCVQKMQLIKTLKF
jgi:hypothetical protein